MHKKIGTGKRCWCETCKKEYHKEYSKKWEQSNKEKRLARQRDDNYKINRREWSKRTNQTEKRREYHRKRYKENTKAMRSKMDEWRANNLDKWNGYTRKRRAMIKGLTCEPYNINDIYIRDNGICGICKEFIDTEFIDRKQMPTIDHILPIALGGNDTPDNVQIAHLSCNARKAHRV